MRVLQTRWCHLAFLGLALVLAILVHPAALMLPLAMGATTGITDMDGAMKVLFNDPIVENVVSDSELLKLFTVDNNVQYEQTTGGRYIETAQYFQLPSGVGARAPGEYIPVPEGPIIKNSRVFLKKIQGVLEMQGDVMKRVKGNPGAFIDWMDRALPDLVTRLNDSVDRMLLGYGAGIKARVNMATPTTSLAIDTAFGVTLSGTALTQAWLNFLEGERIVFSATAAGTTLRNAGSGQSAKVTGINPDTSVLTLDALPTGVADNDYIFEGDPAGSSNQTAAGDNREIMGLLGMVDDGTVLATFQNLARATYRLWNAISIDGSDATLDNNAGFNGVLSEELLMFADDQVAVQGGGKADVLVTSRAGIRSYWKALKADRVLNDPRGYTGGKGKPVSIMLGDRTLELKAVRKMPPQLAFLLQTNTFKRWELDGYQWDDKTGSIWNRVTDGTGRKDAFFAVGDWYMEIGCLAPRKNVRITNIGVA